MSISPGNQDQAGLQRDSSFCSRKAFLFLTSWPSQVSVLLVSEDAGAWCLLLRRLALHTPLTQGRVLVGSGSAALQSVWEGLSD